MRNDIKIVSLGSEKAKISPTNRDRPKSAPYSRLKNRKKTSKCQFTVLENRKSKKMDRVVEWRAKRGTLPKLSNFCRSWRGDLLEKKQIFEKKVSQCRKTKRRTLWGFSISILSQNIKKLKGENFIFGKNLTVPETTERGDPLGKNSEKKSRSAEKNDRGDPLVSPGMVSYAEKQEKHFWFSSLGQMVQ